MRSSFLAAASLALAVSACNRTQPAPQQIGPPGPVPLDVVTVVEKPAEMTLSMPGELEAYESVAIYPKVTGFLRAIRVDRGSHVRAGETLVQLDAPEIVAQRSEAQSKLQSAQAQLAAARAKADADISTYDKLKAASATPGVVAGNDVVVAQKAVEAAQGQMSAAEQNVEAARQAVRTIADMEGYLRVTAPFSGVVIERNVHPGALVGPPSGAGASTPMLRLIDDSRLRLVVAVPEAYAAGITEGDAIPFSVAAYPGQSFSGKVARIAHAVDVTTRTMAVELDVANGNRLLAPGAFAQVRWPVRRTRPSLFVPSGSIASTTDRTFLVRVRNGRAEWVDVQTGLGSGALVEVFGDLKAGDQVAARGSDEIQPGTAVQMVDVKP